LWYLVHRGTSEITAATDPLTLGLSIGHMLVKLDWGEGHALALFSDERRAHGFAAATGLAGLLSFKVATAPQFFELLIRLPPDTTHVGFDPTLPGTGRGTAPVVPVAEILATLRPVIDGN
jgi:hypothetical protein